MDLKEKYHSDPYRSSFYKAQEALARSLLESIISRNKLPLQVVSLGLTETTGVVKDYYSSLSNRFDYALIRVGDKALVALIEVTGDSINDNYARILVEKIQKIDQWVKRYGFTNIYIMYIKRKASGDIRSIRFFPAEIVLMAYRISSSGSRKEDFFISKWIENEKDYLFIRTSYSMTARQFASHLKNIVKAIGTMLPRIKLEEVA